MNSLQLLSFHQRWKCWPQARLNRFIPNRTTQSWLLEVDSLTEKLRHATGGDFRVEVLEQSTYRPFRNEARPLRMPLYQSALCREVVLYAGQMPAFIGRTVIPTDSLTGSLRHLRQWGSKSIGTYLFNQPDLERGLIELCYGPLNDFTCFATRFGNPKVWGRRSCFRVHGKKILISEYFFPSFLEEQRLRQDA